MIIAITLWPAGRLKAEVSESTSTDRYLSAYGSANGTGTHMTSTRSKLGRGPADIGRMPFAQRALAGLDEFQIERLHPPHPNAPSDSTSLAIGSRGLLPSAVRTYRGTVVVAWPKPSKWPA